jgi:hypothetical protein
MSNMKVYVEIGPTLNVGVARANIDNSIYLKKVHHMFVTYVYCHAISSQ